MSETTNGCFFIYCREKGLPQYSSNSGKAVVSEAILPFPIWLFFEFKICQLKYTARNPSGSAVNIYVNVQTSSVQFCTLCSRSDSHWTLSFPAICRHVCSSKCAEILLGILQQQLKASCVFNQQHFFASSSIWPPCTTVCSCWEKPACLGQE